MVDATHKHDGTKPGLSSQSGRSRKLPAWQGELLTSLDGRPEVQFRRVKFNELVVPGDYIQDGEHSYRPWDGPRGFRAASFHQPVYRPEPKTQM